MKRQGKTRLLVVITGTYINVVITSCTLSANIVCQLHFNKKKGGGQEKAVLAEELHKGPGTETQQLPGLAVPGNKMGHGGLVGLEARA